MHFRKKMNEPPLNNSVDTATPVSPPHFDDERTVWSAQPVVPLEQINAKVRHRRHWLLGGAFAIAMILGAASALVASYLKLRNVATPVATEEIEVTAAPVAVAESVPSESPVVEEPQPTPVPVESPKTEAPPPKRHPVAKPIDELYKPSQTEKVSEDEDLNRVRDAVLYDEWQERRARRAERRERRRLDRYNHRDLSNLDEIFEGRRRRINPY
jgi:outer membrane biosynthesis protein TonB